MVFVFGNLGKNNIVASVMLALTKLLRVAAPRSHPAPLRWGHKPKYTPGISPCKSANVKPKINQTECSLSVFPCLSSFGKVWKWFSAKVDGLMVAKSQLLFGACQSRKRPRHLGPRHCQAPQPWCSLSLDKKVLIFRRKKMSATKGIMAWTIKFQMSESSHRTSTLPE